jgi:hypothetical protein
MKLNIPLVKSFKLVPMVLDKSPRPRQIKLWFKLHGIVLEGKPIGLDPKQRFKKTHALENQNVN